MVLWLCQLYRPCQAHPSWRSRQHDGLLADEEAGTGWEANHAGAPAAVRHPADVKQE